jgi:hypothetical protein
MNLPLRRWVVLAIAGFFVYGTAAFAHHGNSDYDNTKELTLKGTIAAFEFVNPHAQVVLDVKNDQGKIDHWMLELASPNSLRRTGWTRATLKAGQEVTATVNPNKNGSKGVYLLKLTFPDGKVVVAATQ